MAKLNGCTEINGWTKLIEAAGLDKSSADKWQIQAVGGSSKGIIVCEGSSAPEDSDYGGFVIYGGSSGNAFEYKATDGYDLWARSNACGNVKVIVQPLE